MANDSKNNPKIENDQTLSDNDDLLAAELVLGLLEGEEHAIALRKQLSDPAFAEKISLWGEQLAPLWDEIEDSEPSPEIWHKIADNIKEIDPKTASNIVDIMDRRLKRWRTAAIGSGAIAASLALVLITSGNWSNIAPNPSSDALNGTLASEENAQNDPFQGQLAVSQLTGPIEGLVLVASYNPSNAQMKIDVSGMPETETQPEIWIIAENQEPQSLGQIGRDGISAMTVASDHRPLINASSTLVLTMEPASDIPHEKPSGDAVASGKITFL